VSPWVPVLVASLGCFALKLAGWSVPARWLQRAVLQRAARLLPLVLLARWLAAMNSGTYSDPNTNRIGLRRRPSSVALWVEPVVRPRSR